jgi:hypothetical protein
VEEEEEQQQEEGRRRSTAEDIVSQTMSRGTLTFREMSVGVCSVKTWRNQKKLSIFY